MTTRKRPLGRGLDALIGSSARRRDSLSQADSDTPSPAQAPPESQSVEERLERLPLRQLTRRLMPGGVRMRSFMSSSASL